MTARLLALADANWQHLDGYAIAHGVWLETLTPARLANFVWWYFTRNANHSDTEKLRARIWQPPAGTEPPKRSPWSAENETKAFASLKSQLGIKGPAPTAAPSPTP